MSRPPRLFNFVIQEVIITPLARTTYTIVLPPFPWNLANLIDPGCGEVSLPRTRCSRFLAANQEAQVFGTSRSHKKVVGFSIPGRLTTSRNARPPSTRSYTLTPPPRAPPSTTQRLSSPMIAAPRRCLRPVGTSATNLGASGFSSVKMASVSPAGLGSFRFVAYRNNGSSPGTTAGASSSSPARSLPRGSSGGRRRVDVVLRRVGESGSGGRWCAVSVLVSSFSVYSMSPFVA
jgi:hypothetical protein